MDITLVWFSFLLVIILFPEKTTEYSKSLLIFHYSFPSDNKSGHRSCLRVGSLLEVGSYILVISPPLEENNKRMEFTAQLHVINVFNLQYVRLCISVFIYFQVKIG